MWLILFKTLEGVPYYGDRPDAIDNGDARIETYDFSIGQEYEDLLEEDFINPMYNLCGSLVDIDESDFFDVEKCAMLVNWLENRFRQEVHPVLKPVYEKILEYAQKAIEYGTGIIIQF
ncbi:hypothetical protein [uncultured Fibrobacter sp.]|uniref:hypothetical protein n=1 Tax=uncultured Fibrobacter sp. TaxID=261512 RepID=UPI002595885A|nr:hypothetical protein [uncultured Fibrobacter sp.]